MQKLNVQGHLTIEAVYDGRREVLSDKKNQIVNQFLTTLSELITQEASTIPAELATHSLWVEASDTALTSGVDETDTGPEGTVIKRIKLDRASDVDSNLSSTPGLSEFRATLGKNEGVGETIRAAGLYTEGNDPNDLDNADVRLIARQLFGAIDKDDQFALEFTWRIQFSIQ